MATRLDDLSDGADDITPLRGAPVKLAAIAYTRIREMILRQQLRPGEKTSVAQLSKAVQLGRSPVKAAVDRLADEGLLLVSSRRGTYVAEFDYRRAGDLFEMRRLYEAAPAPLIVERVTDEEIERIQDSLERLKATRDADGGKANLVSFIDADVEFHGRVIGAAKNERLLENYSSLNLHLLISTYLLHQAGSEAEKRHAEHVAIARALARRDPDALGTALLQHCGAVEELILRSMCEERPSWV